MKKILIWDISFRLENVGGPAGYLYNIHEYLIEHPNQQITFLSDLYQNNSNYEKIHHKFRSGFKKLIRNNVLTKTFLDIFNLIWRDYKTSQVVLPANIDLNSYAFIHFHKTNDVTRHIRLLTNYKGKIILTSHCPCSMTEEILASKPKWYKILKYIMLKHEICAMKKADFLMFPCKEAREPYEKVEDIKLLFSKNECKFFYVPTSLLDLHINKYKMQKLSDLGIPEGSFVIAFFGRHNYIKGYDILKRLGQNLLNKTPNLYFLCAGKGDIKPFQHPRWIELGFVNNTQELLSQCNLYVLPNRETFFDLVVLEVLRAGKPILMANNGGNRYYNVFPKEETKGIKFFDVDDLREMCNITNELIGMSYTDESKFDDMGRSNRTLWEKRFTMRTYIDNYCNIVEEL